MGRLFWKFFALVALAQMVSMLSVATIFWLEHRADAARFQAGQAEFRPGPGGPPPEHRGPPPHADGHRGSGPGDHGPGPFHIPPEPMLAALLTAIGLASVLAWYVARPVRRLRRAFEEVAGGDLTVRIGSGMGWRRDELADLGRDFDLMATRLQAVVEGQRRLLHDVSHELRSPLARLQAVSGLVRQQPERVNDLLGRIERECERMDHLIGQLLTLSRLDAGVAGHCEAVDVGELLACLVEDARFEAENKGCQLLVTGAVEGSVLANAELLHRAIENVLRNALRYAPVGSAVQLTLGQADGQLLVTIEDNGPGVKAGDEQAIFEPFYRSGEAREGTGYGLGLAIARRVVDSMGGSVEAVNRPATGLRVSFRLPMAA